jgi:hypothetical protein
MTRFAMPRSVRQHQVHKYKAQRNQQQYSPAQQQQQQQQQQVPAQHQILTDRRKMVAEIVLMLQKRKPNAPLEWLKKLPLIAKRLEALLYCSASSLEAYNDMNTLKFRLQQLAIDRKKNKKMVELSSVAVVPP